MKNFTTTTTVQRATVTRPPRINNKVNATNNHCSRNCRDHSLSLLLGEGFEQASKDWEYAPKQTGEKSGNQVKILEQFLFWKNSFRGKSPWRYGI